MVKRIVDRLVDDVQRSSPGLVARNQSSVERLSLQVSQRGAASGATQVDGNDEALAPIVFKQSGRPA